MQSEVEMNLPKLGIGCWSFGGGSYWGEQSQMDVDKIVSASLDNGLNYFDTAEMYNDGESEKSLGLALKGRRSKAIIGTKVWPDNCARDVMTAHCEQSLRRLNTDYIDIYMVHWPLENYEGAAEAMNLLIEQGKVRFGGVSNHGPRQMAEAAEAGLKYSVNQVMYNLISRGAESSVCADAAKRNVAVMGYMPLMQGLLTGKYDSPREIPPARMRTRHFAGTREGARHGGTGYEEIIFKLMAELKTAAVEYGTSPGAASLAWCLSRSEIACEVTGIRSAAQLESGLEALKLAANTKLMSFMDMLSRDLMLKMGDGIDYWESDENSRSR
jgi:aryl-alcohol dehydrogenase-like predicted oxidoreductase